MSELGAGFEANLASNSVSVQMHLAHQMGGLCITHDFAMASFPNLVRVLPDQIRLRRNFYLIRHRDEMRDRRISEFADILVTEMRNEIQRLEDLASS